MVGQSDIRPRAVRDLPDGSHVGVEVVAQLLVRELVEEGRVEVVVGVGHVDRQHPADVRQVGGAPDRLAVRLDLQAAVLEAPHRVDEGKRRRVVVLAQEVHLVAHSGKGLDQGRVVDVAARPAQQVAVEDQDPHGRRWSPGGRTPDMFPRL